MKKYLIDITVSEIWKDESNITCQKRIISIDLQTFPDQKVAEEYMNLAAKLIGKEMV